MELILNEKIRKNKPSKVFHKHHKHIAKDFLKWYNKNNGKFSGLYQFSHSMAHGKVCPEPLKMFVVRKELVGRYEKDKHGERTRENFFFPKQLILNPEILEILPTKIISNGKRCIAKDNMYKIEDACICFPLREPKSIDVANVIKVRYKTLDFFGNLVDNQETICGMKSHIFQHEFNHTKNIDIYMKKAKRKVTFKELKK